MNRRVACLLLFWLAVLPEYDGKSATRLSSNTKTNSTGDGTDSGFGVTNA